MSGTRTGEQTQKHGNQVVHVREGSDAAMQQLFDFSLNQKGENTVSHVPMNKRNLPPSFFVPPDHRGHSREGSTDSTHLPLMSPSGLPIIQHSRAHSSPATLQATLSAAPLHAPPPPLHMRTQSYDIADDIPLPPGWEMAKTAAGQKYFLNHLERITTWEDPRKALSPSTLNQPQQQQQMVRPDLVGPFPPGWEQASTPDGEVYFINHVERTTSWHDPRLLQPRLHHGPVPGHQQQVLSPGQQRSATLPAMSPQERQRQMQLQQLQMEKERLKRRQDELARQCNMLQEQMIRSTLSEEPMQQLPPHSASGDINTVTTSGVDPFLGQGTVGDFHSRQESADSGLGGMVNNYSLPRTPDDFLSNVSEMDAMMVAGGGKMQQEFSSMEIGGGMDGTDGTANMDSDDLVPSIHEDISSELLNDMETVLNTDKMENVLTWL